MKENIYMKVGILHYSDYCKRWRKADKKETADCMDKNYLWLYKKLMLLTKEKVKWSGKI